MVALPSVSKISDCTAMRKATFHTPSTAMLLNQCCGPSSDGLRLAARILPKWLMPWAAFYYAKTSDPFLKQHVKDTSFSPILTSNWFGRSAECGGIPVV